MSDLSTIIQDINDHRSFDNDERINILDVVQLFDKIDKKVRELNEDDPNSGIKAKDFFPESFYENANIGLDYIHFKPSLDGEHELQLALSWINFNWEIIPDILIIENFKVEIEVVGQNFYAELFTNFDLEGYQFLAKVELPNLVLKANLNTPPQFRPSPLNLLKRFNALPDNHHPLDEKTELTSFLILANPKGYRYVLDFAINHIPLGTHITLDTQIQIGVTDGIMDGSFFGEFIMEIPIGRLNMNHEQAPNHNGKYPFVKVVSLFT